MLGASAVVAYRPAVASLGIRRAVAAGAVGQHSSGMRGPAVRRLACSLDALAQPACLVWLAEEGDVEESVLLELRRGSDPRRRFRCCRLARGHLGMPT